MAFKAGPSRQRLPGPRVAGVLKEWKGNFGWIHPDSPVRSPSTAKNGGRVYAASTDFQGGATPHQGMRVEFALYSDGSGIGAQQIRSAQPGNSVGGGKGGLQQQQQQQQQLQPATQVKGVIKTIQKNKLQPVAKALPGRPVNSGPVKAMVPQPKFHSAPQAAIQQPGAKGGQTSAKDAKFTPPQQQMKLAAKAAPGKKMRVWSGAARAAAAATATKATADGTAGSSKSSTAAASGKGGKKADKGKSEVDAQRTTIHGGRWYTGKVTQFFGRFGWIEADMKIDHPKLNDHKGLLYCHVDDLAPSCSGLSKGMAVKFQAYADASGLGARELQDKFAHMTPVAKAGSSSGSADGAMGGVSLKAPGKGVGGKGSPGTIKVGSAAKGNAKGASSKGVAAAPKPLLVPVQKTIQKKGALPGQASAGGKGTNANSKGKAGKPAAEAASTMGKGGLKLTPPSTEVTSPQGKSKGKGGAAVASVQGPAGKAAGKVGKASGKASGKDGGKQTMFAAKGGGGGASAQKQPALPVNWEEHWSDEHAVPYFWNRVTKESRWIKPSK